MDLYFIHDAPLWIDILIICFGVLLLAEGLYIIKIKEAPGPWFLFGTIHFKKEKNPHIYWLIALLWIIIGLFILTIGIISII